VIAKTASFNRHPGSFRDPAGFILEHDGILLRAIHPDAIPEVEALFSSGLHDELADAGLLTRHEPVDGALRRQLVELQAEWMVLRPERLPVISYGCEWTDAQLQAAALLTLDVQERALARGMSLKDASSFNVQFKGSKPIFIDLLSLERSGGAREWVAYRQFCEHFLAPLAMRHYVPGSVALAGATLGGVPLELVSRQLPLRSWTNAGVALHLHLHARSAMRSTGTRSSQKPAAPTIGVQPSGGFRQQLAASLRRAVSSLVPPLEESNWSDYRTNNTYSDADAGRKRAFVEAAVRRAAPDRALDLGANDGHYARAVAELGVPCTAVEFDAACAERIHAANLASPWATSLNTVRMDLTNPTPAHGWAHRERSSFADRLRCDLTLSLALVHHLSIAHHVPFDAIAEFLATLAPHAIVEYVPREDPMVRQLLAARTGVTAAYLDTLSHEAFIEAFGARFDDVARSDPLAGGRVLHHFVRRD
jgi:hypothetical protein